MELQIFENVEFGIIRSMNINGEPWFVGKDVAGVFGYKETAKAIREHVDEDDRGVSVLDTPGGSIRITKTTKCTGKGQQYFVNKFLKGAAC